MIHLSVIRRVPEDDLQRAGEGGSPAGSRIRETGLGDFLPKEQ